MKHVLDFKGLLLQSLNPGKSAFTRPQDTNLPDSVGLPVAIMIVGVSVYLYFTFYHKKPASDEREATRKLLESLKKIRRKRR